MNKILSNSDPSKVLLRIGVCLPILLYRSRLGWILGGRFLMLTTTAYSISLVALKPVIR